MVRSGGGALMGEIIKRHGGYSIRWYEGGRRRIMASRQATYTEAKRMLVEIEARVARGEAGIPERRPGTWPTVAELIDRFVSEYSRPKLKDVEKYRAVAKSLLRRASAIHKLRVDQVSATDVAKVRDVLLRRHAPGSTRNTLRQLGTMWAWGIKEGLAPSNPCLGVEKPLATTSLDFLTREEVKMLLDAAAARTEKTPTAHMLYVAIALALHTGMRKGEVLGLRWCDLDLETRRLTVARSYRGAPKSGKSRHLRLPQALVPILHAWRPLCPPSTDGAVLPIGRGPSGVGGAECMLGIRECMAEIGIRQVAHPFHIMRHSFASHYVMAGGSLLALQKILGHSDPKTTQIYAHLAPDFLGDEMDRLKF